MQILIIFLLSIIIVGCKHTNNAKTPITEYKRTYPDLDGLYIVDSMELIRIPYACDCPDWKKYRAYMTDTGVSYSDTNNFYIEPAGNQDPVNKIDRSFTRVMLYGKIDTHRRYPKNADFMDPDPPVGRVFIYSAYSIIDSGKVYTFSAADTSETP